MNSHRSRSAVSFIFAVAVLGLVGPTWTPSRADIPVIGGYTVRLGYLIPSNRTPQPDGVANLQAYFLQGHEFYREQMERNGFGPRSFRYETEADGVTPMVHVFQVAETDEYLRGSGGYDLWGRAHSAAYAAGVPVYQSDEIWFIVPETHLQLPTSEVIGGVALGGGNAMCGSDMVVFSPETDLTDNRLYNGMILPELGPYPLIYEVTYPWFTGNTLSGLTSSWSGATMHELGHAFGLNHDFRNDGNFEGNLMGNGLRGFRGWRYPDQYPADECRLGYGAAFQLSLSPYFEDVNNPEPPTELDWSSNPTLLIQTTGVQTAVNGLLEIQFTAADGDGLALALLYLGGDLVGEMDLGGATTVTEVFRTAWWNRGQSTDYNLSVWDVNGNRAGPYGTTITPTSRVNTAPQPWFCAHPSRVQAGEAVTLNASGTRDANHSIPQLLFEWDLNGDGVFDTTPTHQTSLTTTFATPGCPLVRLRVTDPEGASTVSTPIPVRVDPVLVPGDINCDGGIDFFDIDAFLVALGGQAGYEARFPNCYWLAADCDQDGDVDFFDIDAFLGLLGTR